MQITVVALMCHTLAGISQPVCREEIVVKDEMPMPPDWNRSASTESVLAELST
jgi:hypothetical protein